MSNFPENLRYSQTHEWVQIENDAIITIGITDHAQHMLGDLVFVELPELNVEHDAGDEVAVVESVKTAADIYCPVAGEVVEVNTGLQESPGMVNQDPYGTGWLFRLRVRNAADLEGLLDSKAYKKNVLEA